MKISVVIPCHNCGRWVQNAIRSVAAQTYPAHEIIVVDDSSTDDSVEQIKASGVSLELIHTQSGNAAAARNAGITRATGDWIALLDADDMWYSEHLASAREALCHGDAVAYMAAADYVTPTGAKVSDVSRWPVGSGVHRLSFEEFLELYARSGYFCHITAVLDRRRMLEIGGYDERFRFRHDVDMFMRLIHNNFCRINTRSSAQVLLLRDSGISANRLKCGEASYNVLVKNHMLSPAVIERLLRRQARVLMGMSIRLGNAEDSARNFAMVYPNLGRTRRIWFRILIAAQHCLGRHFPSRKAVELKGGG